MLLRWLSALGALILLFGTLYFAGPQGLAILGSLFVLIAAIEFCSLFEKPSLWFFSILTADTIVFLSHLFWPQNTLAVLAACFMVLATFGVVLFRHQDAIFAFGKIQWTLWGVTYTGLFPALAVQLLLEKGWTTMIYLLVTVFFGDTFAFFAGRYVGGPKIFPHFSPKKTVSGAVGGLTGSVITGSLFLMYFAHFPSWASMVFLSLAIGLFAQFGDFFESIIKRVSGKKDTSQIMPGHGGLLDRLDGVYFGAVVLYFFCVVLDFVAYF